METLDNLPSAGVDPQQAAWLLRSRRTVHLFRPDVPPRAWVLEAIEAARWAPNHHLTEPWRFYLLGPSAREAIVDLNAALVAEKRGPELAEEKRRRWREVPAMLAVTCVETPDDPHRRQEDYAACCCAVQNLMLALWARGVGMKWSTGPAVQHPRFLDVLGVPRGREFPVGLFFYGYPQKIPPMKRSELDEFVFERP